MQTNLGSIEWSKSIENNTIKQKKCFIEFSFLDFNQNEVSKFFHPHIWNLILTAIFPWKISSKILRKRHCKHMQCTASNNIVLGLAKNISRGNVSMFFHVEKNQFQVKLICCCDTFQVHSHMLWYIIVKKNFRVEDITLWNWMKKKCQLL